MRPSPMLHLRPLESLLSSLSINLSISSPSDFCSNSTSQGGLQLNPRPPQLCTPVLCPCIFANPTKELQGVHSLQWQ